MRIEAGQDAYTAYGKQHITHNYAEQLGSAGGMSIKPPQVEYPVRGREELVSSLLEAPSGTVHVLCAPGGYGKTTVALAAAEQADNQGHDVWRVSAADAGSLSAGMRTLAVQLGAAPERLRLAWSGHDGDAPDLVWELLARHERPWLLIVDNADDPQLLAAAGDRVANGTGWIRRPPTSSRLVVTSRNGNPGTWGRWVALHPLGDLLTEQAAQVLLDRSGSSAGSVTQAAALAVRLGHLPLMLHQAGLYLAHVRRSAPWPGARRNPRTFEEYRVALDERFGELVDGPPTNDLPQQRSRVTGTWELTLDLLADQGLPSARSLMRLLAHFADAPIPYAAILSPHSLATSPLFATLTESDLEQTIEALADFGLLTKQTPDTVTDDPMAYTVTIHPAIGETIRTVTDACAQRHDYLTLVAENLSRAAYEHDARNPADWPFWQLTASHVQRLCTLAITIKEGISTVLSNILTTIAAECIKYALSAGFYPQAEATIVHAAVIAATLDLEQPAALQLRYQCARMKDHQGDLTEAEAEYRAVLAVRTRVLGAEHPDTLSTRHNLAWVLAQRGELANAQAEFQVMLTDRIRVLGSDHPGTLWTRYSLAAVLDKRGDLAGGQAELQKVLANQTRILGTDHPDTLRTRHSLAWVLSRQGDVTGGQAELQKVLADQTRILGTDHPHTFKTRHTLAWMLALQGDLISAHTEYRALLADQTRILGTDHPDTLATRHALVALQPLTP